MTSPPVLSARHYLENHRCRRWWCIPPVCIKVWGIALIFGIAARSF